MTVFPTPPQVIQSSTMLTLVVRVPRAITAAAAAADTAPRNNRPVARSSPRGNRSAEPAVQRRRRSSSSRSTAKPTAPAPQAVPKVGGKSRKGLKMSTIKAMLDAVQDFPTTTASAANAVRQPSRVSAAVKAQPRPNPAAAAKRRTPPRTRVSRQVYPPSVTISLLTAPVEPPPATARRNPSRSRANVLPSRRAGISLPTIVEPPHSSTDSSFGGDSNFFGDDLGSPIAEGIFERRGAGVRRRSSSDSEPIYENADAMNTSGMYGFDDSFTEEADQMEYADWVGGVVISCFYLYFAHARALAFSLSLSSSLSSIHLALGSLSLSLSVSLALSRSSMSLSSLSIQPPHPPPGLIHGTS